MRFGICNEIFADWPWEAMCDFVAQLGYHGVEVAPFTLADSVEEISSQRRRQLREAAAQRGLEVIGLHWLLVKPEGLYITHPDGEVRRRTAAYLRKLVHLAADLGGRVLVIGSPKQRNLLPGVSREQAMGYAKEVFEAALEAAIPFRITLALEPLSPKETNFITTAAEAIELIQQIDHPLFRLHLDVKAMSSEERPIPEVIVSSARYLVHFHANDPNLLGPGMGDVRFEPIIAALRQVGYQGYLSVEVFDFSPGPERIARESLAYLRQVTASA